MNYLKHINFTKKNTFTVYCYKKYFARNLNNKVELEQKWKDRIANFSSTWKDVCDENSAKQIENIKNEIGQDRIDYIKAVAEAYSSLNNYQYLYVENKIKEYSMNVKGLSAIDVNTDWVSILQKNDKGEVVPPVNPEFFEQQELMSQFTEWLKTQKGLDFGLASSASSSTSNAPVQKEEKKEEKKEEVKEKQIFDIFLASFDAAKKITVIKAVREITNLGLKEAKELVETSPQKVKEKVKKEDVKAIVDKIEAAGGKIELKYYINTNLLI